MAAVEMALGEILPLLHCALQPFFTSPSVPTGTNSEDNLSHGSARATEHTFGCRDRWQTVSFHAFDVRHFLKGSLMIIFGSHHRYTEMLRSSKCEDADQWLWGKDAPLSPRTGMPSGGPESCLPCQQVPGPGGVIRWICFEVSGRYQDAPIRSVRLWFGVSWAFGKGAHTCYELKPA